MIQRDEHVSMLIRGFEARDICVCSIYETKVNCTCSTLNVFEYLKLFKSSYFLKILLHVQFTLENFTLINMESHSCINSI